MCLDQATSPPMSNETGIANLTREYRILLDALTALVAGPGVLFILIALALSGLCNGSNQPFPTPIGTDRPRLRRLRISKSSPVRALSWWGRLAAWMLTSRPCLSGMTT